MAGHPGLLGAALAAAGRGWRVFPLRPADKRPAVRDWENRATGEAGRIRRCWSAGRFNVGLACGRSGLVVVDLDVAKPGEVAPAGWRLPGVGDGADVLAVLADRHGQPYPVDTYAVRTGRGGWHLYFTPPPGARLGNSAGRLGWLVDTRGHGGYVVAAGSRVGGRRYTAVDPDAAVAPLPGWLARLLVEPADLPPRPSAAALLGEAGRRAGYAARRCAARCSGSSTPPRAPATTPSTPPRSASVSSSPPGCCQAGWPPTH